MLANVQRIAGEIVICFNYTTLVRAGAFGRKSPELFDAMFNPHPEKMNGKIKGPVPRIHALTALRQLHDDPYGKEMLP